MKAKIIEALQAKNTPTPKIEDKKEVLALKCTCNHQSKPDNKKVVREEENKDVIELPDFNVYMNERNQGRKRNIANLPTSTDDFNEFFVPSSYVPPHLNQRQQVPTIPSRIQHMPSRLDLEVENSPYPRFDNYDVPQTRKKPRSQVYDINNY